MMIDAQPLQAWFLANELENSTPVPIEALRDSLESRNAWEGVSASDFENHDIHSLLDEIERLRPFLPKTVTPEVQKWLDSTNKLLPRDEPPLQALSDAISDNLLLTALQQLEVVSYAQQVKHGHKVATGALAALHVAQKRVMLENLNLREKLAKKKATIKALWRLLKLSI